ncbi:unnamed protein product [Lactuca virosa]|uniref:Exocyst subunit Exo70 family protein n=1 Tax=Lactuca virosa TaxID=75947 RepID=A0AAU9M857_9ASTR|nr:unnamed protein product [Lactuca virosa]
MEHLIRTRDLLKTTLHQSTQLDLQIHQTTTNLSRINSSKSHITNIPSLSTLHHHLHRALPPVSAVFQVYQVVEELGGLLSDHHPSPDLHHHLSLLKRFSQALTLLTNTCNLAILWVEDINTTIVDNLYHSNVSKTLHILKELQRFEERSLLKHGILNVAFENLKHEFTTLLIENSFPLQVPLSLFSSGDDESDVFDPIPEALPFPIVKNLQDIVACFSCNNLVDQCIHVYIKIRGTIVHRSLEGLDLDYLEITLTEFHSVQEVEGYIDEWGRHLEFVVKHLLELEYTLCEHVFSKSIEVNVWKYCFSKIALQSGIQSFIKFGNTITKCKKEAIKLFKLLDIFTTLNNLRQDFNRIFGGKGKPCSEIQSQTRGLLKNVVNGACEIFQDLKAQVELQRLNDPPPDGTIPKLVIFVTEYANELLDDEYKHELEQVLKIHSSWHNESKFTKGIVSVEIKNIVKSLELNLDTWAKRYEDASLSYIFLMNTSCYLSKHLKGTKLGDLMGESWIKRHEVHIEYYTSLYLKESWGRIPALLSNNDRNKMKGFNDVFDQVFRKQSEWVLCDRDLRWKTCQMIMEVVVPVYKTLVESGATHSPNSNKYLKYSDEKIENMLTSMFRSKLDKYGSSAKCTSLMGKIKNVVTGHFSPANVAA